MTLKYLLLGIPLTIFTLLVMSPSSEFFASDPALFSKAITIDFVVTVPLIYYLVARRTRIPTITTVPVFLIGVFTASYLLPNEHQEWLDFIKYWILPLLELTLITIIFLKVRKIVRSFRKHNNSFDFYSAIKQAASDILPPKLDLAFAFEIAVFYYALFSWRQKQQNEDHFTYHKETATQAILGVFILAIGIETIAVHLLLVNWNPVVAWILTCISIYTGLQLLAIAKSLSKRPIQIQNEQLILNYGVAGEAIIPFESIKVCDLAAGSELDQNFEKLSPIAGIEDHNLFIELNHEVSVSGFYGMKKSTQKIAFHVDDKERFLEQLNQAMNS